jgi:acyl-CoA thioesterase FadM
MLLRFVAAVLGSLRRPRVGLLEEVASERRCWPTDCDANLHMNDGRYLTVSGVARVALMVRIGLWPLFRTRGWRPVAGAADVRYFREIRPFARYRVRSRILSWDEKYFYFEQVFELRGAAAPVPAARVLVRGLFRGPAGPIPTAEVLAALAFSGARPEPGEELARWMELAELVKRRRTGS